VDLSIQEMWVPKCSLFSMKFENLGMNSQELLSPFEDMREKPVGNRVENKGLLFLM
jgi:hypothetical protein